MFVDKGGLGAGVVDRLRELNIPVVGVNSAERARDHEIYENRRAEMWWTMKQWFDDAVFNRDVATLDRALGAKVGDTLQHPSGNYKLDGMLADNGFTVRFTLQPA